MATQRIMITGSNGLLGQKLLEKLRDRKGLAVLAVSRGVDRTPAGSGYEYRSVELTNADELRKAVADFRPAVIINCAAMTQVDACETDPDTCHQVNVAAVRTLTQLAAAYDAKLVQVSTDFVFDGADGPYSEEDVANPLSVYGRAKYKAEQEVRNSGIAHVIVRTVLVYGVLPGGGRSNIVLWLKGALEAGETLTIVDDQYRTPTLVDDLADGIISAIFLGKTGLYHISGAELMSIYELAQRVADFWQLDRSLITPVSSADLKQAAPRPPQTGFIILKAQSELDYQPRSFEGGLRVVDRQLRELYPHTG